MLVINPILVLYCLWSILVLKKAKLKNLSIKSWMIFVALMATRLILNLVFFT